MRESTTCQSVDEMYLKKGSNENEVGVALVDIVPDPPLCVPPDAWRKVEGTMIARMVLVREVRTAVRKVMAEMNMAYEVGTPPISTY